MKKRIIGLILIVVMLTLSLVSCGYSLRDDDLSKYATLEKADLDAALAGLVIENTEFGDEAKRPALVLDSIYTNLATAAKDGDHITEGKVGAHDVVYYNYYATVDGGAHLIYVSSMKPGSEKSVQLGLSSNEGVQALIAEKVVGIENIADYIYKANSTSGTIVKEGDKAYVSYTVEYVVEAEDGTTKTIKETVTYERVTAGDTENAVASKIVGAKVGTAIDNFDVDVSGVKKTYSSVKVNWVVESDLSKYITFTDTTFTESTSVKDIKGASVELANKEITYYVYPVHFVEVEELTADTVMNTLLENYVKTTTEDDGTTKEEGVLPSFTDHIELLKEFAELVTDYADAKKAYDKAVSEEEKALAALDKAKDAVEEGKEPTDAQKDTINKAQTAYDSAKETKEAAKTTLDEATEERDGKLAKIYEQVDKETIINEYKNTVNEKLLDEYKADIKEALAKAVWEAIGKHVTVNDTPRDLVQEVYDRMIESYKSTFYSGTYDTTTKESNYKHYNASFSAFLIAKTGTNSYENAKHHVWADAVDYVKPMISVYYVAELYGQKLTDAQIKEYKKDLNSRYSYYEAYYGETNALTAYQFDVLMNHFLELDDENDSGLVYKNIHYDFKAEDAE